MYYIYDNDCEQWHYMSFVKLADAREEVKALIQKEESIGIVCEDRFVIYKQIT